MGDATPEKSLRVAYLGPPNSFSNQAASAAFAKSASATLVPLPNFIPIFTAIQNSTLEASGDDLYDYAVLPVENSTNGGVVQVYDLFVQSGVNPALSNYPDIEVVSEHYLEVHHCLYVHPDAPLDKANGSEDILRGLDIKALYTHPQVWGQCEKFLTKHFKAGHTSRDDMSSTSAAAAHVAKNGADGKIGVICSKLAGAQNKLTCLATNIEDEPGKNTTRFLILRNRKTAKATSSVLPAFLNPPSPGSTRKSLIALTIPHTQSGSLASVLSIFQSHNFNLTVIICRPAREKNWQYAFFIECEEPAATDNTNRDKMLKSLETVTEKVVLFGTWGK